MGCNQSKSQDIQQDRQRIAQQQQQQAPQTPSASVRASSGRPDGDDAASPLGTTYTDQRLAENENFFQEIIDRTAQNFIYISQTPAKVGGSEAMARASAIASRVPQQQPLSDKASALFAIPQPAEDNNTASGLLSVLNSSSISSEQQRLINDASSKIVASLSTIKIQHVGDLVVSFPEISA